MARVNSDGSIILSTKIDSDGLKRGFSAIKNMAQTAVKSVKVISATAVAATAAITKMTVSAYADYEQLIGGVETLFKDSAQKVVDYANEAYKTAGVSANEYMQAVTSFSASLLNSLSGDTEKAADIANQALIDMSDNANKMGTSMESIQNAYQGFAKQNYTMLDNLKLGYGGTKTEMERLLKDAEALTGVKYDITNLADVYSAIHAIQEELGITGTTAKEAEKTISGSAKMMKAAWKNVLNAISGGDIDEAINNLTYSIEKYFENILPVVDRALSGIGVLIERIAPKLVQTVARAVIKAIPQLIVAVKEMVIGIFQGIKSALTELLSGESNKVIEEQAKQTKKTADNQKELTGNVKDTNKELKKTLAGFDEIQILSSETTEDTSDRIKITDDIFNAGDGSGDGSELEQKIETTFANIAGTVAKYMIALGCILLLTGNIPWGIGLIIAGAIASEYEEAQNDNGRSIETLVGKIGTILSIVGTIAIILGIILCWAGFWGVGVKLIIIGAASLFGAVALNWDAIKEALIEQRDKITIAAVLMIALGIFCCIAGMFPLGIGAIVVGVGLIAAEVALNWDAIKEQIKEQSGKLIIVGPLLVALGILLCCAQMWALGIGAIVAGVAIIVTAVALNWDAIKEKTKKIFNSIIEWVKKYGLLVLGILLCLTGVGIPFGIALIIKWAKEGAEKGEPLSTKIVEKVKEIWGKVKAFWNEHIAQIFTKKWWIDKGKEIMNGLISGIESGINGVISGFEWMINKVIGGLNKISVKIPDWLGGGSFGINIKPVEFGRVSIPRLAQGAVLPPNKPFMAVVGDQKRGTNIEAPLDTIVEAMNIALAQNGNTGGSNIEVVLELDGREFGRAVVAQGNKESRRIGTRLVVV